MIQTTFTQKDESTKETAIKSKSKIMCSGCGKYLGNIVERPLAKSALPRKQLYLCVCTCGDDCFPIKVNGGLCSVVTESKIQVVDSKVDSTKLENGINVVADMDTIYIKFGVHR